MSYFLTIWFLTPSIVSQFIVSFFYSLSVCFSLFLFSNCLHHALYLSNFLLIRFVQFQIVSYSLSAVRLLSHFLFSLSVCCFIFSFLSSISLFSFLYQSVVSFSLSSVSLLSHFLFFYQSVVLFPLSSVSLLSHFLYFYQSLLSYFIYLLSVCCLLSFILCQSVALFPLFFLSVCYIISAIFYQSFVSFPLSSISLLSPILYFLCVSCVITPVCGLLSCHSAS